MTTDELALMSPINLKDCHLTKPGGGQSPVRITAYGRYRVRVVDVDVPRGGEAAGGRGVSSVQNR